MAKVFWSFCAVIAFAVGANAHGRLFEPPGRSSLWRFVKTDPMLSPYAHIIVPNYSDNQLFCGGLSVQSANGGKCGVCGDSWSATEKPNEAGGKYALGIITRVYKPGQTIDVEVQITAHHKGFFEFRLCPWDDPATPVTHDCLDRYLLQIVGGGTKWIPVVGVNKLKVKLPDDVICETQCVFQWRYHTGNSWGRDENGEQGIGLGPQEEFYACSDIRIVDDDMPMPTEGVAPTTKSTQAPTTTSTQAPTTTTTTTRATTTTKRPITDVPAVPVKPTVPNCTPSSDSDLHCLNCKQLYRCVHGRLYTFLCPAGAVCGNGLCNFPYNVPWCNKN